MEIFDCSWYSCTTCKHGAAGSYKLNGHIKYLNQVLRQEAQSSCSQQQNNPSAGTDQRPSTLEKQQKKPRTCTYVHNLNQDDSCFFAILLHGKILP